MKKILSEKTIYIIIIAICCVLCSSLSVWAYSYFAKDVSYKKADGTEISVENALYELYKSGIKLDADSIKVLFDGGSTPSGETSYMYTFTENYKSVIVYYGTTYWATTKYETTGIEKNNIQFQKTTGRDNYGIAYYIYSDIEKGDTIKLYRTSGNQISLDIIGLK